MQFKNFMEALKGNQHKIDKNKNGKLDAQDFELLRKEEDELEEADRVARADYKVSPSGRKSHKEIVFKDGEDDGKEYQREAVEVSHDRYMRSHGKPASGKGQWMFTHKRTGDVDYNNDRDVHRATGSYSDAKKSAQLWAKKHGHNTAYVMEVLDPSMGAGVYVKDFKKSDAPQFKGKSKDKRVQMAIAAYMDAKNKMKEEVEHLAEDAYEKAEENKRSAEAAKKQGDMFAHHLHMADHHDNMAEWHASRGRNSSADRHMEKSEQHQELAMQHKDKKPMKEQAPVAPSLVKHRIGVTVSEPDHPMVSKRKEKVQKFVIVTHSDNKEGARAVGEKFYKKKGYRVHDSYHAGIQEEVELDEQAKGHTIEAHGVKGMKSTPWRKTFKHEDHLNDWAEKNDAEVHGVRDLEHVKEETLDERNKENATKRKMMDASRGARYKAAGNPVPERDPEHKTAQAQNKAIGRALRNEDADDTSVQFDEEGNLMNQPLSFTEFLELNEMEFVNGRYVHKGTYGSAHQDDDEEDDDKPKKPAEPAVKRGRGRPAGSKSGANHKVTSGKNRTGVDYTGYPLHLPNR